MLVGQCYVAASRVTGQLEDRATALTLVTGLIPQLFSRPPPDQAILFWMVEVRTRLSCTRWLDIPLFSMRSLFRPTVVTQCWANVRNCRQPELRIS